MPQGASILKAFPAPDCLFHKQTLSAADQGHFECVKPRPRVLAAAGSLIENSRKKGWPNGDQTDVVENRNGTDLTENNKPFYDST
jgi:hypothetical protein